MDSEENFEKKIGQLILLFKKLRRESRPGSLAGFDPAMLKQIDFLISNFEKMKSDPSAMAMFAQMGKPFEEMLTQFIRHMSEELGESAFLPEVEEKAPILPPLPEEEKPQVGTLTRRLVQIDQLLAKGGLTTEDEDQLLDERIRIMHILDPEGNP